MKSIEVPYSKTLTKAMSLATRHLIKCVPASAWPASVENLSEFDHCRMEIHGKYAVSGRQAPSPYFVLSHWLAKFDLDHGAGHPILFGLAHGSLWWAEGCGWNLNYCQNGGKHPTKFLPEKSLCRGRSVR